VRSVTHSKLPRGDRLTIELTTEGSYSTNRAGNPDRVILDLANATMTPAALERVARVAGTLVKSIKIAKGADESTRFILEVTGTPRYSTFPLYNPFRLVLDVESEAVPAVASAPAGSAPMTFAGKSANSPSISTLADVPPAPVAPAARVAVSPGTPARIGRVAHRHRPGRQPRLTPRRTA
jgi:hypothetical protein